MIKIAKWISKSKTDKISRILMIMLFLFYTNMIIPAPSEAAVSITTTLAAVNMDGLKIGNTYKLSEVTNGIYLTATNIGEPVDIEIIAYGKESFTEADKEGYEVIPDSSWVSADPNYFTNVPTNDTIKADMLITIPNDTQYLGKKYEVKIFYMPRNFDGIAGGTVVTKVYFTISTDSGDITPPAPPTNVSVVDAGIGGQLNLSWTNPTDADFNHIHIYRSTTSAVLGNLVYDDVSGTSKQDTGLTNGVAYYYTLRSVDNSSNESTNTDQYSGIPTATGDMSAPEISLGSSFEKVILLPDKKIKIEAGVTDNNKVTSVKLYYRKTGETSYGNVSFSPAPDSAPIYDGSAYIPQEVASDQGVEYYIEAFDGTNYSYLGSAASPEKLDVGKITIITFGLENIITVINGEDGSVVATLTIPGKALSGETTISVKQLDITTLPIDGDLTLSSRPVIAFEFTPHGLQFNKPVTIKMAYLDADSNGIVDDTNIVEATLSMFYYDGFEWRYLDGTVDTANNTVTSKIHHFSTFALFPAKSLAASDYRPKRKIITPNGDGTNDVAEFTGLTSEIKIFDITGKKIRTISAGTAQWDGKDDDGDVVRNGVYIYQFEAEGELVSGTIAVAK